MRESQLIRRQLRILSEGGAKAVKFNPRFGEAGTPDIIGCYQSKCFLIEVKATVGGQLTPLQVRRCEEWREVGAVVIESKGRVVTVEELRRACCEG